MTTIIGIKTNSGEDGIVLAADLRFNWHDDSNDQVLINKEIASKIRIEKNYALGFSGLDDNFLNCFFNYLAGKINYSQFVKFISGGWEGVSCSKKAKDQFSEAIRREYLDSLNLLNRFQTKREGSVEDGIELILALNNPKLQLYHVDSFGNLISSTMPGGLEYVCCGSGSKDTKGYFDDKEYLKDEGIENLDISMDSVTIPVAIKLAIGAMRKASKNPEMGELTDLVIVKKNQIDSYVGEALKAVNAFYEQLIEKYQK